MSIVNIDGLELSVEYDNGYIVASNDQLEVKYMAKYKPDDDNTFNKFVSAKFSLNMYQYDAIIISVEENVKDSGKHIINDIDLVSSFIYNHYDSRDYIIGMNFSGDSNKLKSLLTIARLETKLMCMRVGTHIYMLKTDKEIRNLKFTVDNLIKR